VHDADATEPSDRTSTLKHHHLHHAARVELDQGLTGPGS